LVATAAIPTVATPPMGIIRTGTSRKVEISSAIRSGMSGWTTARSSFTRMTFPAAFIPRSRSITFRYPFRNSISSAEASPETTNPQELPTRSEPTIELPCIVVSATSTWSSLPTALMYSSGASGGTNATSSNTRV